MITGLSCTILINFLLSESKGSFFQTLEALSLINYHCFFFPRSNTTFVGAGSRSEENIVSEFNQASLILFQVSNDNTLLSLPTIGATFKERPKVSKKNCSVIRRSSCAKDFKREISSYVNLNALKIKR